MKRWAMVVVCALGAMGLATGCDDDDGASGGGTGGRTTDAGDAGSETGAGTGGAPGTGGTTVPNLDAGDAGPDATSETGSEDGGGDDIAPNSTVTITAAAGGKVAAGGATLSIPAGALNEDETISVIVIPAFEPATATILGQTYAFAPEGTSFHVPAALTLPLGTVPADKKATVAWMDDDTGQWFPVPSTVDGGSITGLVSHFTAFAVILLDKEAACPFSGACGGSLEGTWEYDAACAKTMPAAPINCGSGGTVPVQQDIGLSGTVTVTGNRYTSSQRIILKGTVFFTPACLAATNEPQPVYADCDAVEAGLRKNNETLWSCLGTLAQGCSCVAEDTIEQTEAGAVAIAGNTVAFTKDGATSPGQPGEYCVKDDSLVLKDARGSVYVAKKQ